MKMEIITATALLAIGPEGNRTMKIIGIRSVRISGLTGRIFMSLVLLGAIFSWRRLPRKNFRFSPIPIWIKTVEIDR
jgi:hypothetical protein